MNAPGMGKNMVLMPALLGMGYIDFTDQNTLNMTIAGYITAQCVTFALYAYVYSKIQAAEKPNENPVPDKTMTTTQYDRSKLMEIVKQSLMGIGILSAIYYKWESPKPLFLQMLMAPSAIMESPLFSLHVRGKEAEGELERPWKPPPGMFDAMKEAMDQPVTAAVDGAAAEAEDAAEEETKDSTAEKKKKKTKEPKQPIDASKCEKVD